MWKKSERQAESYKIWVMAVLLTGACISLYYFHVILGIGTIITHIFYVPIILASIWWKRKGLLVALFASGLLIFSHVFLRPDVANYNDYVRAFMFIVTAFVVAELSRRIAKEHKALQAANQQLRAANQQLKAGEQQLKASNQQLSASEQQLVSEVAERKKAEKRIREQREFLRNTIESLSYPFYVIDANDNTVQMANSTAWQGKLTEKITCYMLSHKQNKPCRGPEHPCPLEDIKKTKQPAVVEHIHYDKDGNPRNVEVHCYPIFDDEQNVTQIIEYCLDITDRKKAEEALRESEGKLSAMLQSVADPMSMMDKDLNIIWANEMARKMFGDDIAGRKCYEAYHQRNKPCEPYPCLTLKAFQDGKVHEHDTQVVDKEGQKRYFHCIANVALRDSEGKPTAVLDISRDITDRKKAEEALRESENSYRAVVENAVEGIVVAQGQTLQFVNPALVSMTGYSEKELLTRPFVEFIHPDHREWAMGIHIKRLKGEEVPTVYEFKVLDKKGNTKWLENSGILIEWRNKPATLNFIRDITERKQAEQAIWASESEKKSILNAISDQLLFHDTDLATRWCNEAAARSIGMTQRELIGCYCYELWHDRSEPCEQCPVLGAIETGSHTEGIMTTPNGRFWEVIGEPVCGRDGKIRGAIEIARDITERKKAENALQLERDNFINILDSMEDGVYIVGRNHDIQYVNPVLKKDFGPYEGRKCYEYFHDRKEICPWCKNEEVFAGKTVRWEWYSFKNQRKYDLIDTPLRNPDGSISKLEIFRDITEHKKAEEALRSERDKLQTLMGGLALTRIGIDVVSIDYRVLFQNQTLIERFGDITGKLCYEKYMGLKKPCDFCPMTKAIRNMEAKSVELTAIDGRSYELISAPLANPDGTVDKVIEVVKDITENKQAKEALQESELKFKTIFENAGGAIFIANNKTGEILECNSQAEQMLGRSRAEIIGMHQSELHPKGEEEKYKEKFAAHVQKGHTVDFEGEVQHKDGRRIPVWIAAQCLKIGGKDVIIGLFVDTTKRKKAEQKLIENRAKLKSLASQLLLIEERERHRLATELHDQIGQSLVMSKMKLDSLRYSVSSGETNEVLGDVCDCLGKIIQDTRTLTFDLSSPILYELGFEAAVAEWLEEQIQEKHGIKTDFEDDGQPKPLDDDIRVLLFRNVRELLVNVVKHANAKNVTVSIHRIGGQICVSVEDDGVGFNPVEVLLLAAQNAGFGLFSIRERLEQLGGYLEIESKPGRGSKITMTAPLKC